MQRHVCHGVGCFLLRVFESARLDGVQAGNLIFRRVLRRVLYYYIWACFPLRLWGHYFCVVYGSEYRYDVVREADEAATTTMHMPVAGSARPNTDHG